eukprot:gene10672-12359_t
MSLLFQRVVAPTLREEPSSTLLWNAQAEMRSVRKIFSGDTKREAVVPSVTEAQISSRSPVVVLASVCRSGGNSQQQNIKSVLQQVSKSTSGLVLSLPSDSCSILRDVHALLLELDLLLADSNLASDDAAAAASCRVWLDQLQRETLQLQRSPGPMLVPMGFSERPLERWTSFCLTVESKLDALVKAIDEVEGMDLTPNHKEASWEQQGVDLSPNHNEVSREQQPSCEESLPEQLGITSPLDSRHLDTSQPKQSGFKMVVRRSRLSYAANWKGRTAI